MQITDIDDYQQQANQFAASTTYPHFDASAFLEGLELMIEGGRLLDAVKRQLFYDDPKYRVNPEDEHVEEMKFSSTAEMDVIHAMIGILTEAGETAEAYRDAAIAATAVGDHETPGQVTKYLLQEPIRTNLMEEGGDGFWYQALMARALGFTLSDFTTRNIAKLDRRYKDRQFSTEQALTRDLDAEGVALGALSEGG